MIGLDVLRLQTAFMSLGVATLVAAFTAYPIYLLLVRLKARQTVSEFAPGTHQAKQGTPTMGGLIPLTGILAALLAAGAPAAPLVLLLGFGAVGFADDYVVPRLVQGKRGLGWKQKLAMQLLIAAGAVGAAGLWREDTLAWAVVGLFLILFFSNAYNFSDGLDGLAGSLGLILAGSFVVIGIHYVGSEIIVPAAAICGGLFPFLFLNAPPAKIFMGDVGSLPIGALFGWLVTLSISYRHAVPEGDAWKTDWTGIEVLALPVLILSLIMFVELVPVPLQILSVKLRKKKLFPYTPIHHAFELVGWKETRVVWTFALLQLLLAIVALSLAMWLGLRAGAFPEANA